MLKKTAIYLSDHPFIKHLAFLAIAIMAIWVNGYYFGTFDQSMHIPFLNKIIHPELYPNDSFLNMRSYHFSYFWFFFIPMAREDLLQVSMFLVHILTVYGTVWMFWALSEILFSNPLANLMVVVALIFPHLGFPGFQIIEFSLLNRTFALPFILGSIWLYLKDKRILAYLLLGLMLNIHAVYVIYVLCMFLLHEALTFNKSNWWEVPLGLGIFSLMGLPVLIWRMQTGNGIDLTLRPDLLSLASNSLLYTVYYPIGPFSHMIGNFLAGLGTVWAFTLGYRQAGQSSKHQTMKHFILAIGILFMVAVITSYLLPITILLQFQILRAGVFLLYFGVLYLSYFLAVKKDDAKLGKPWFTILAFSFIFLITPLITIFLWLLSKALIKSKIKPAWLALLLLVIQIVTVFIGLHSRLWSPGFQIHGPHSNWQDVQVWAQHNTSVDAGFITPPHLFGHYISDWRVFSQRATLVSIAESMEIPFNPNYLDDFKSHFSAVAPGAIESFNGNFVRSMDVTKEKFYTNSTLDLIEIACQYGLDFLVVEKTHPYPFVERYRNNGFIVYQMPACP